MKSSKIVFALFFLFSLGANAQSFKEETFKVYGNCSMCKTKIEKAALGTKGVMQARWNSDNELLTITYKPKKVALDNVKKNIAAIGYDTDEFRAPDEVYENLHWCCQYERPAKKKE